MKFRFGRIWLDALTFRDAVEKIGIILSSGKPSAVSVMNLRTIGISLKNKNYARLINGTSLRITDGMPLVWAGKMAGIKKMERITGPDLFMELLNPRYGFNHFFLGDTTQTLHNLTGRIQSISPGTKICGSYSPPFRELSEEDMAYISKSVNQSDPDIIWVSLGSPKQDFFSARLLQYINRGVLINVGAAFRFYLGEYSHPNPFFQKIGLEGIFWRFRKNPFREFIWYIKHIPLLLYLLAELLFNRHKNINPGERYESSSS